MVGPNFTVKLPPVPLNLKPRPNRIRKSGKGAKRGSSLELETIVEANIGEVGKSSSYYTIRSPDESRESVLNVLETYDEFLNLKDLGNEHSSESNSGNLSNESKSMFLLKQICTADLQLASSDKESQILALFQNEYPKASPCDIQTAIIAQRIIDTQKKIAESRKTSKSKFGKSSSFNKSVKSLLTIEKFPRCSSSMTNTLSTLTSRYFVAKSKCDKEVQANILSTTNTPVVQHSCNTQTDEVVKTLFSPKFSQTQTSLGPAKLETHHTQSTLVSLKDQCVNTIFYGQNNTTDRATQMYEHITENDLLCMEWINNNLFRVPVNPNVIIVDEKVREVSEVTCFGTNMFEQEANWEMQALCT